MMVGLMGGGMGMGTMETMPNDMSGPALGEAAAGMVGDGHHDGMSPGRPSRIPGPKPGGMAADSGGGRRNSPPVLLPPRCGAVPPALPPGQADSDNGDHSARAAARGDAGDGDPLGNDDTTPATIAGKADNAGKENDNRGSDDGDDDKNDDKWGRGA
jgi:hypothetical protein